MAEILERQLLIRGRAFATFSTIEKALADRKISYRILCRRAVQPSVFALAKFLHNLHFQ